MKAMRMAVWMAIVASPVLSAQSAPDARAALARAMPMIERSASSFVSQRACVSCHHNILPILLLHEARERGVSVDAAVLSAVETKTFRALRGPDALDDAIQAATLNDPTPNDSFLLMAAHAAGMARDLTTEVYARRLLARQRDGHWVTSDFRPPHSSSVFTATATAIRAIRLYLPEEMRTEGDACVGRAREWLMAAHPASTEDASFRVLGLVWAGAAAAEIEAGRKDLLAVQLQGGGWPELPDYQPDAYSTGEALYALRESGMPDTAAAWRRGVRFLISTQAADGTWRVRTRMVSPAEVSPPYFTTGFPYQKDEYLSYAGTCWAVMALLSALPETPVPLETGKPQNNAPGWVRTALFGTPPQLAALLDSGLDPNTHTAKGTTLLMMATPDAEKVRLLLKRGADPKTRSASGCDALTLAASYRGTAASIKVLLEAGAEVKAPAGVHVRNGPLVFASMTGDLQNVKLLLEHGADASGAALSAAVTFGYGDVVRALIAAGASVRGTEASGINLLHWAVIADRPEMIPVLAKAGVSLNATDENGYTPLMYAATIDFGDMRLVKALVEAGADPNIRNADGRTAPEQARYFHHARLAAAFR